ncbi:DNA topoisomerase 2-beta [Triplophysa tibetana]|uniref:DNA topoisomerase 2-beta n=1 Tax=Triplophysa tibetana TaxID=1572043 RepID=A0A5A9MUS9_9TELE|nr:DNA topoisomerase 2-beta [Triplophysa tibetana]
MTEEKLAQAEAAGLHKVFKLQSSLTCNSMVLFDHMGCLKRYESVQDILKEFFELRLHYYKLRKDWLVGSLGAEAAKLSNQARFVLEKIEGKISIENKSKRDLIRMLVQKGFESDPVAAWNKAQEKSLEDEEGDGNDSDSSVDSGSSSGPNFNYILNMPLWCFDQREGGRSPQTERHEELNELQKKIPEDLWREDLAVFIEELDRLEEQEKESVNAGKAVKLVKGKVGKPKVKKMHLEETLPSPFGRRIEPQVTQAMKADASKKLSKKKKGESDAVVKLDFDEDGALGSNGGTAENSLTSPSGLPNPGAGAGAKAKAPRVKREKKEPGTPRQRKPAAVKGTGKKVKKRNPWSEDEEDEEKSDNELDESGPVIPRDTTSRRASAVKAKYTFDFSEEEDDDGDEEHDNDVSRSPVQTYRTNPAEQNNNVDEDDDDDDIFPPKPTFTSSVSAGKKDTESVFSSKATHDDKSSDDDVKSDSDDERPPVFSSFSSTSAMDKPAAKKAPAKKATDAASKPKKAPSKAKKSSICVWDSDSDTAVKKAPAAAAAASVKGKMKKVSDDEDDDDAGMNSFSRLDMGRDRSGRAKKEVKYFAESDNDDNDMFD